MPLEAWSRTGAAGRHARVGSSSSCLLLSAWDVAAMTRALSYCRDAEAVGLSLRHVRGHWLAACLRQATCIAHPRHAQLRAAPPRGASVHGPPFTALSQQTRRI